jgi:hypothetical protein
MFRKIAVALIATSVLAAPALAAKTAKPAPAHTTGQALNADAAAKAAVKPVATLKVVKKHRHNVSHRRHHPHHMFAGKHHRNHVFAGKHRGHVKHIATHKAHKTLTFTKAPKHKMHVHRVVKVKKPIKTHRAAAL